MPSSLFDESKTSSSEEDQDEDILEEMLAEAGRLANEMRCLSSSSSRGSHHVPETIDMKDGLTDCSSMEGRMTALLNLSSPETATSSSYHRHAYITSEEEKKCNDPSDDLPPPSTYHATAVATSATTPQPVVGSSIRNNLTMPSFESRSLSVASSGSASVQEQRAQVKVAIKASQDMARKLRAIPPPPPMAPPVALEPPTLSSQRQSSPDSTGSHSPLAVSPTNIPDQEGFDENDDNYTYAVPVADYSKTSTAVPAAVVSAAQEAMSPHARMAGDIKWEKMDLADQGDDDYVPIADYSNMKRKSSLSFRTCPEVSSDPYSRRRAVLLRKRRQQRRRRRLAAATAVLVVVVASLVAWYYQDALESHFYGRPETAEETTLPTIELPMPSFEPSLEEIADAETCRIAEQEAAEAAQEAEMMAQRRKICWDVWAKLSNPLCREERHVWVTEVLQLL